MVVSGKGEILGYEKSGFDPVLRISYLLMRVETLSITGQIFVKVLFI